MNLPKKRAENDRPLRCKRGLRDVSCIMVNQDKMGGNLKFCMEIYRPYAQ